jgi:16S rRNA (cytidine1402-2'-O)-methyltransferase
MKGILWLVPNVLDGGDPVRVLSDASLEAIRKLRSFIVEDERTARRFLVRIGMKEYLDVIKWGWLNEHTLPTDFRSLLEPLEEGMDTGLLSEAGCPGIADPGAEIVKLAHENNIRVKPLTGPSSILLALMASGLNGQNFAFHGYLPVKPADRIRKIRELEQRSKQNGETQIFIEAPYRNRQLFNELLNTLSAETLVSVAVDLTSPDEFIQTAPVWQWHGRVPDLHKRPAVFLVCKSR